MHELICDLRYTFRTIRTNPGMALVIIASLAIGIGANTAIFSVVDSLLLKPLPYPQPDRLAVLWLRSPGVNIPQDWPSPGQYIDILNQNSSFEKMSISQGGGGTLIGLQQPERIQVLRTSSSLFELLGARPLHGRLFNPAEDKPGHAPVAILSHAAWQRLYRSDPAVIGKSVTLNGVVGPKDNNQFTVIGVLPRDFLMNGEVMPTVGSIQQMEIFIPLPFGADAVNRRGDENYNVMARLKPGVSMAQAKADVAVIAARIRDKDKRDKTFTIDVVPLLDQVVGDVRRAVLVLLGSVALVLLIACSNVANLLLSRSAARQKEVAIRTALGAGWRRLVRQFLTESVTLGILGAAAGLLIAKWSLYIVRTVNPGNIPRLEVIGIDARVLAFTFAVAILTGMIFGLAPALRAAKLDLNTALKAGGRSVQDGVGLSVSRNRLRSLLVVSELAFSLILLIGAGLLIRSFIRIQNVSPGFNPDRLISLRLGATGQRFENRDVAIQYYRRLHERIAATPGVTASGAVTGLPFTASIGWGSINVEGFTPAPGQELQVDQRGATPNYFRTMEIPLVKGRFFTEDDFAQNAPPVVIIDEKFAQRFWPQGDAIGKQLWNNPQRKMTIVGVVGAVKHYGLDIDGRIAFYRPGFGGWIVARTSNDPAAAANAIVREINAVDPTVPVYDTRTMNDRMSDSLARRRFSAIMLGAFSVFALILAAVGVYGVMSYLVTQGTHDIGVRLALGAQTGAILALVVRRGAALATIGIIAGLVGAAALTRVMSNMLFGTSATDIVTFSAVPLVLGSIALLATWLPARRATRVDPIVALRDE